MVTFNGWVGWSEKRTEIDAYCYECDYIKTFTLPEIFQAPICHICDRPFHFHQIRINMENLPK
jgi:hypothetical protein